MYDKHIKLILNTLKCPICKGQVDLYDYLKKTAKSTQYNFCCSNDYEHYRMWFPHWDAPPVINYDVVDVYEGRHKFRIDQRYLSKTGIKTTIDIWEIDAERHLVNEQSKISSTIKSCLTIQTAIVVR